MGLATFADKYCKISLNGVRVMFAEFFGTFILTVIGIGTTVSGNPLGPLAGGIGVTLGIYYACNASGGHVNPAVTAAFWIQGRLSDSFLRGTILMLIYWASQIGGAFTGAATAHAIYADTIPKGISNVDNSTSADGVTCIFATCPNPGVTCINDACEITGKINVGSMFFDQVVGTFILVSTVLALTDPRNAYPPGMAPLFIGLSATAVGVAYGGNAGGAINPARDFGPRIWASFFDGDIAFTGDKDEDSNTFQGVNSEYFFWIPLAGPIVGGLIAGVCYVFFIMAHWPAEPENSSSSVQPRSTTSSVKSTKHNPYADEAL